MAQKPRPTRTLAEKIDHLFTVVHPAKGEYTHEQVATAIEDAGGPTISATYLWQLQGRPRQPHQEAPRGLVGVLRGAAVLLLRRSDRG
jgi:hypothetical protein